MAVITGLGLQGVQLGVAVGASMGAFNAAINGGNFGDIAKGALIGGIQGGVTAGILHGMEGVAEASGQWYDKAAHVAGHGVVGGAANEAMGGKFQDGFISGAAGAYAGWTVLKNTTIGTTIGSTVAGRTAIAGIVGGTASALGGGKFANGAWTAAFQHLLNAEAGRKYAEGTVGSNDDGGPDPRVELAYQMGLPVGKRPFLMVDYWGWFDSATKGRYGLITLFDSDGDVIGSWNFNNGGASSSSMIKQGHYSVRRHWSKPPNLETQRYAGSRNGPAFWLDGYSFKIHIVGPSATPGILFHPDGAGRGTEGCFGILGNRSSLATFNNSVSSRFNLEMHTPADPPDYRSDW